MSSNIELLPTKLSLQDDYSFTGSDSNNNLLPVSENINRLPRLNVLSSKPQSSIPVKSLSARYQVLGNLGSGSFGTVSLAKIRTGALPNIFDDMRKCKGTLLEPIKNYSRSKYDVVAIKTMTKKLPRVEDYTRVKEVKFILALKSHPCLVQIYDLFIDGSSFKLHIVMESMDQNLYQLMKYRKNCVFSPKTLKSILAQILAGIRHIHKNFYYHRDVKPENILIMQASNFYGSRSNIPNDKIHCPYIVKLADYGLARRIDNHKPYTAYVSTRWYRSPEILLRQKTYSYPIDIWAFGCVAVEAATFCPLFPGSTELDQTWRILEILGCPDVYGYNEPPLGGYWDDAQKLASGLGFSLPKVPGTYIEKLVPRLDMNDKEKQNFCKFVKQCLTWNPNTRIDVHRLCEMEYFDGTIIREEDKQVLKEQKNSNFLNKSQEFAGLTAISNTLKASSNNKNKLYYSSSSPQPQPQPQQQEHLKSVAVPINNENEDPSSTNDTGSNRKIRKAPHINMNVFNLIKKRNSNVIEKKHEEVNSSLIVNGDMSQLQESNFNPPLHNNSHINSDDQYPEPLEFDNCRDDGYPHDDDDNDEFEEEPLEPYEVDYNNNNNPQIITEPYEMFPFDKFHNNFKNVDNGVSIDDSKHHNPNDFANNPNSCDITDAINYALEDDYCDYNNNSNLYDWTPVSNL